MIAWSHKSTRICHTKINTIEIGDWLVRLRLEIRGAILCCGLYSDCTCICPPKRLLGGGFSTLYTPFCLIRIVHSEPTSFNLYTNEWAKVDIRWYPVDGSRLHTRWIPRSFLCGLRLSKFRTTCEYIYCMHFVDAWLLHDYSLCWCIYQHFVGEWLCWCMCVCVFVCVCACLCVCVCVWLLKTKQVRSFIPPADLFAVVKVFARLKWRLFVHLQ